MKKAIGIHLPQFHSIPENDSWWGEGFTEWTNVKKSKPKFRGHYQPHVPFEKNYYLLDHLEHLHWQKDLAIRYGLHGFCFYHYWFNGQLLLDKPIEMILKDASWNFPFCLCWANENWTRRWDGLDQEILMQQNYSLEDDRNHFNYFAKFFRDDRYISIDGKPLLLIYRSELFPDIKRTLALWRNMAIEHGFPDIYVIHVESFYKYEDPAVQGFDASLDFQPDWDNMPSPLRNSFAGNLLEKLNPLKHGNSFYENRIYSYADYVEKQLASNSNLDYLRFPSIFPGWDNSARRQKGAIIFRDSNPELYGKWLRHLIQSFNGPSIEEDLIFINAWNEWAEGNHLEPCEKWGHQYLEKTHEILKEQYEHDDSN